MIVQLRSWWIAVAVICAVAMEIRAAEALTGPDPRRDATVQAIEKVMPSVVNIGTKTLLQRRQYFSDWFRRNWVYTEEVPQYSAGSGVIVDEEGYVLSNVHVVENATEVWVKLSDGRVFQAKVVAGARNSDVAVLKLNSKPGEKFQAAQLAAEDDLLLGETVIAMGNPFGLGGSVSRGILSSKSRREKLEGSSLDVQDWLQTDAAINPGNSGGPLINLRGEVIGLNVAVYREGQGIGFAIPIKRVVEAFSELFTPEALRSLWFGATFQSSGKTFSVATVDRESPAAIAGLKAGDLVQQVNQATPRSLIELHRMLVPRGNDRDIEVSILRDGKKRTVKVSLIPEDSYFNAELIQDRLGVTVQPVTPAIAAQLRMQNLTGLLVTAVDRNGPAAEAGIQRGYILRAINREVIDDVIGAAKLVHRFNRSEAVKITALSPRSMREGVFEVVLR